MNFPYQIKNLEQYQQEYKRSLDDPSGFWGDIAEHFTWKKKWDTVVQSNFHHAETRWFEGAQLNITENCLDRHLADKANQTAILFEPNDPNKEVQKISYAELHQRVMEFAWVLKNNGVKKETGFVFIWA